MFHTNPTWVDTIDGVQIEKGWGGLLDVYHDLVNHDLAQRGWPAISKGRLAGLLVSHFLLAHQNEVTRPGALTNPAFLSRVLNATPGPGRRTTQR
jgi:hypothetical protein